MKRVVLVVLDSVGIGELPDALKYGDVGSNTLCNIKNKTNMLLPNLEKLGLGNIDEIKCFQKENNCNGSFGRMMEMSSGKDTTTGHWEISGLILEKAFPVYPNGFPKDFMDEFEKKIGTKTIANYPSSGTKIIEDLGEEHDKTGYPIVYTSADSVFQIACNEQTYGLDRLYEICEIARDMLKGEHAVGRVIARPFIKEGNKYIRTKNRKDYSLKPFGKTILDYVKENNMKVKAVGKIEDIFAGKGITDAVHTRDNSDGINKTLEYIDEEFSGLIFTNLVDFDMMYGHRNDVQGYSESLIEFDTKLPQILNNLKEEDILIITADHGCDPTYPTTDHTREYVPVLIYGKNIKKGVNIGTRKTFSDIAKTIAEYLHIDNNLNGESFLNKMKQ